VVVCGQKTKVKTSNFPGVEISYKVGGRGGRAEMKIDFLPSFLGSILLRRHSSRLNHHHKMSSFHRLVLILLTVDYHKTLTFCL
jgi:hypothetical protein